MSINPGGPARPAPWPATLSRLGSLKGTVEMVHNALDARLEGDSSSAFDWVGRSGDLFCEKSDVLVPSDWSSSILSLNCSDLSSRHPYWCRRLSRSLRGLLTKLKSRMLPSLALILLENRDWVPPSESGAQESSIRGGSFGAACSDISPLRPAPTPTT